METSRSYLPSALLWLVITTILLSLPGSAFPKVSWLESIWADKIVHLFLFAIMVILWCKTFSDALSRKKAFLIVGLAALLYGVAMEFIQKNFVPHRSFDVTDIVGDGMGAALGYFVSLRYIKK